MLTRTQLLGVFVMAMLGGLLGGSIGFGIVSGEFTLALICLEVIVALFAIAFVIGSGSGEKPAKPYLQAQPIKQKYRIQSTGEEVELSFYEVQTLTGANGKEERDNLYGHYFGEDYPKERVNVPNQRRAGDQQIGGEVLPEFQSDLIESVRQMKAGKAARTHKVSI